MNNQNYQILLGIILLVVYFTCFKKSEGFAAVGVGYPLVGKEICFNRKLSLYGGTRDVRLPFGRGLIRGSPRVVKNCKDGKVRKVIAQVMRLIDHKSHKKAFRKRKHYWRTFKRSSGWTSQPLPADKKKADRALLNFAGRGYRSMIIYGFGKVNSKVRLNKKKIPLSGWSRNSKDGPAKGSFIRYGSTDRTLSSLRFTKNRLRECNRKLREAKSNMGAAPRQDPAFTQQAQAGGGDAW